MEEQLTKIAEVLAQLTPAKQELEEVKEQNRKLQISLMKARCDIFSLTQAIEKLSEKIKEIQEDSVGTDDVLTELVIDVSNIKTQLEDMENF